MEKKALHILHFNDAYQIQEHKDTPIGGTPRFITAMKSLEHLNPLKFFSGDLLSPADLTPIFEGEQVIVPFNEMHLTASCLGNHDFDLEYDQVLDLLGKTNSPWVMTNLFMKANRKPIGNSKEYLIVEHQGLKIGVMGLAEEDWLGTLLTIDRADMEFLDPIGTAKLWCQIFRKEHHCDYVIALTHMRVPNDRLLAQEVQDLDLILGGHDHIIWSEKHGDVVAVKSGTDFRHLGHITIEEVGKKPENLEESKFKQFYVKDRLLITVRLLEIGPQYAPDVEMQKHVEKCLGGLKAEYDVLVGYTDVPLEGRFARIRLEETNLANFLSDIALGYTNADFFLGNTGTIRHDGVLPQGPIRFGDIKAMLPYEDYIEVAEIKGSDIKAVLENGVSKYPSMEGRFPMVSGISFAFDPRKPAGERVDLASIKIQGQDLNPDKIYLFAGKYFLISGGRDGYEMLKSLKKTVTHEYGIELVRILLHFFAYQPKAKEEMLREVPAQPTLLRRQSSLERRTQCLERTEKLIYERVSVEGELRDYIKIRPTVEARIVNLYPEHEAKEVKPSK